MPQNTGPVVVEAWEPAPCGRDDLESIGTAANLVSDAQVAALAIHYGAVLHTADADFVRFHGLGWFNPLTGTGSARVRRSKS